MKYMIVECHASYAVALDDEGRFLKVANMHYQVGQRVAEVVKMREPEETTQPARRNYKWMYAMVSAAACILLIFTTVLTINNSPYASIIMTINPEVRIDVNRRDMVVGLAGVNDDGKELVVNYTYKNKELKVVMDELVDLAIEMGYLSDGDKITLNFDAEDNDWIISHENDISDSMNEHLKDKMSITIQIGGEEPIIEEATVMVQPETSVPQTTENIVVETPYNDSDYETMSQETATTKKAEKKPSKTNQENKENINTQQSKDDKKEESTTKKSSKKKNNKKDKGETTGNKNNNKSEESKPSSTTSSPANNNTSVTDDSNYGESNYQSTDDGSSNYEVPNEGDSNYGGSNYEASDDGGSDYGGSDYDDGSSDYD